MHGKAGEAWFSLASLCVCACFYFTVSATGSERVRAAGDFISQRDGWVASV